MISRREFLVSSFATLAASQLAVAEKKAADTLVNDIHSQLNRTRVREVLAPTSAAEVQKIVRQARRDKVSLSIAGGRHAMGGQQFGTDTRLLDMRGLRKMLDFDAQRKIVTFEAGAEWPEVISNYLQAQQGKPDQLGIAQKQTGADRISLGGTIACNAHGRGLTLQPFVSDVESLQLVNADESLPPKSCPTRAGGHCCNSRTPIRARHSMLMRSITSPRMDSCTGRIHTSSASIRTITTERSIAEEGPNIPGRRSSRRSTYPETTLKTFWLKCVRISA
jgi:FAD/FMN-containing dehydrogenase